MAIYDFKEKLDKLKTLSVLELKRYVISNDCEDCQNGFDRGACFMCDHAKQFIKQIEQKMELKNGKIN
jgi:hypothetical protein